MNYFDQLCEMYPEKKELLWYMHFPMQHHLYAYGGHSNISWEHNVRVSYKIVLCRLYKKLFSKRQNSNNKVIVTFISEDINKFLIEKGYVVNDLWSYLSIKSYIFLNSLQNVDFNQFLTRKFEKQLLSIKEELSLCFKRDNIRFLLLNDDVTPLPRIAIAVCRELNIPTGVFLHGLPGVYNLTDNFQVDYTFVWGEKIKENYKSIGCTNKILVTGNPKYSEVKEIEGSHNKIVVISFCAADVCDGPEDFIMDRGLCIQYVYSVQSVLQKLGIAHAVLRVHPHEKIEWYKRFVDTGFYELDTNSLEDTLVQTLYMIGPLSSVIIDAVSHQVPYYPYIITKEVNSNSWKEVPPYRQIDGLPVARSKDELQENIINGRYVEESYLHSYYAESFDISVISECFKDSKT